MRESQSAVRDRAQTIRSAGGIAEAVRDKGLGHFSSLTLSEALILGLLNQGVRTYVAVFGLYQ